MSGDLVLSAFPGIDLLGRAFEVLNEARDRYPSGAIVGLYSGGHDSTVATHLSLPFLSYAAHIITGTGIPETDAYVAERCEEWGLPLINLVTPPEVYRNYVLGELTRRPDNKERSGFPGPSAHQSVYWYLKQSRLAELNRMFRPRRSPTWIIHVTGIRRQESARRRSRQMSKQPIQEDRRHGNIVWVNPILDWSARDIRVYMEHHRIPTNPVVDSLHRSGECLCGAFAKSSDLREIEFFYPEAARPLRELELEVARRGLPNARWGGQVRVTIPREQLGLPLCSSCELRALPAREPQG